MEFLEQNILGNTILQWLIAFAVFVFSSLLLRISKTIVVSRLSAFAGRTETYWDDVLADAIARTRTLFLLIASFYIGSLFVALPPRVPPIIESVLIITLLFQAGIWVGVFATAWLERYRQRTLEKNPAAATTINSFGFLVRVAIWAAVLLLALDNLGIDITALVAGLGIGGIAIALAVQNVLGDLFASLSIVLDKPFVVGDFLIIDNYLGSVEYVGLKTTRLRSLSGEQLVFANSDLLNSRIRNYGRMFERRVVFSIGVIYETPREKLKAIPAIIRDAIESQENTRFDRSHFSKYADFSLEYETVFYVLSPDYNTYMDIQQAINFRIHEKFEQEKIEFAYPTQKLYVAQVTPTPV